MSAIPPPVFIDRAADLEALARRLLGESAIAVDTEADSFFSYREKVCLLQISTAEADYLVDPLAPLDLAPLAPVLASRAVRKVFHDAEYDVQLLKCAGFAEVAAIFDTRIGVSLLGSKSPGLANVVRERYGIALDKGEQRSDWRRRPLSAEQLDYARHDTRHLLRLAADVEPELRARDRYEIFLFECERVSAAQPRVKSFRPEDVLAYRGARELDPHGLAALRELALERERVAAELDLAPFRVVPSEVLVLLAKLRPRDSRELFGVRALAPRARQVFGRAALEAIARARAAGPWIPARRPEPPEEELAAYERLRRWRTRKAEELQMDASGILHRQTMEALARSRPTSREALAATPGLAPWQLARFGDEILRLATA